METLPCPRCERLEGRIAELERRLGLDSGNSSKPPSSDGLAKKARVLSLRESSGRPSGGQVGHKGETLSMVLAPDIVIEHRAESCTGCRVSLVDAAVVLRERRQVFDIPEAKRMVTEHCALTLCCSVCGLKSKADFPEGVDAPVQYGARMRAMAVYLSAAQMIPEDRLQTVFSDVFSVKISTATLANMNAQAAERLAPAQEKILAELKVAAVKHLDETGFRINGKTQWLHVTSNAAATHYRTSPKRGNLLSGVSGVIVHDHWKPYFTMDGVVHALCNAHILRELKAIIEIDKEAWAKPMQKLLQRCCHLAKSADPPKAAFIHNIYDRIVAQGLAFHEARAPLSARTNKRRDGHNLLLRLQNHKNDVLRFLSNPLVPFTNNQAEQDIRMMKVKQKISGGFRSQTGAEIFCTLRGFLSTARKQTQSPFTALQIALA